MMGARSIRWVKGDLIIDGMRQFCGHWKESNHIFDGDGVGWVGRGVWCRKLASG